MKKHKEKRKRIPSSVAKYIRKEKARIKREALSDKEYKEQVEGVYKKLGIKVE